MRGDGGDGGSNAGIGMSETGVSTELGLRRWSDVVVVVVEVVVRRMDLWGWNT